MKKIIPEYEGEVWCISKHLLSSSMRLMEVGTKQQSLGNKEQAYELFNQSYELYCLFWGINMNILNLEKVEWAKDNIESIKEISEAIKENPAIETEINDTDKNDDKKIFSNLKGTIKKLVNCCIE